MRVVLAPNTFRGSLSASEAVEAMARGVAAACPSVQITRAPMADGGDGTLAVLADAMSAETRQTEVRDPDGNPRRAAWAISGRSAIIEMAEAGGLRHLGSVDRDLTRATTYGTGELIRAALDAGCQRIYLGVGGSATIDGGTGALSALGAVFRDDSGRMLTPEPGALGPLTQVDTSGLDPRLTQTDLIVLADVTTKAADCIERYGPQKGLRAEAVPVLTNLFVALRHCSDNFLQMRHGGAAGGLAAGLVCFAGARVRPGARTIAEITGLGDQIAAADLVITGEGRFDHTSLEDKVPSVVCQLAAERAVPAVVLAGSLAPEALTALSDNATAFGLQHEPMSLSDAIRDAPRACQSAAEAVMRLFTAARRRGG